MKIRQSRRRCARSWGCNVMRDTEDGTGGGWQSPGLKDGVGQGGGSRQNQLDIQERVLDALEPGSAQQQLRFEVAVSHNPLIGGGAESAHPNLSICNGATVRCLGATEMHDCFSNCCC